MICLLVYKFISDIKEIVHSAGLEANNSTPKTKTSAKTDPRDSNSEDSESDSEERIKRLPQVICIGAKKCGTGFGLCKSDGKSTWRVFHRLTVYQYSWVEFRD